MQMILFRTSIPTLNEHVNANRINKFVAAKQKRETEEALMTEIWQQKIKRISSYPAGISYRIYAPDKRTDKMNRFATTAKFVEDALVKASVIRNDGWKDLTYPYPIVFEVDKEEPRVEVILYENH